MLNWSDRFNIFCFLDNHQYHLPSHSYECLAGFGSIKSISTQAGSAFQKLYEFLREEDDWLFGHFGYDLKNEIESLHSGHVDRIQFPDLFFFIPEIVISLNEKEMRIGCIGSTHNEIFESITRQPVSRQGSTPQVSVRNRISRNEYLDIIEKLRAHILRGDCYEINFCQEFYSERAVIDPLQVYVALSNLSPNPFSAYYRLEDKFLLCASPERFLKKNGNKIISQPIKGTRKRVTEDPILDAGNKLDLMDSAKDKSENVMVVDLVRNDLSRVCQEGTVKVEELFGIYTFPQVFQMVSTITGELKDGIGIADLVKASFPMGSMTGAPKKKVMELIDQYEATRRGLFSGAVGYISPERDCDFNVVIRSILYNASAEYLSFQTGSAITWYSNPELEYEECLLKAAAIKKVLEFSPAPLLKK